MIPFARMAADEWQSHEHDHDAQGLMSWQFWSHAQAEGPTPVLRQGVRNDAVDLALERVLYSARVLRSLLKQQNGRRGAWRLHATETRGSGDGTASRARIVMLFGSVVDKVSEFVQCPVRNISLFAEQHIVPRVRGMDSANQVVCFTLLHTHAPLASLLAATWVMDCTRLAVVEQALGRPLRQRTMKQSITVDPHDATNKRQHVCDFLNRWMSSAERLGICNHCGRQAQGKGVFKRCGRCRQSAYCSPVCQRADWPKHKQWCVPTDSVSRSRLSEADKGADGAWHA